MRFRYLRDPVFLVCVAVYLVNRFVLKKVSDGGFVHNHLNDLICIPMLVPVMLYAERKTGLRNHDAIPRWYEILFPLLIWSIAFEIILPGMSQSGPPIVADHRDVLYYVIGGLGAVVIWQYSYRDSGRGISPTAGNETGK
jgi:hypothetical protein